MAAVIGELIKNHGIDALDNGDLATLYNALLSATASATLAGLMSAADKAKLDGLISSLATQSAAGYMSAADKTLLDTAFSRSSGAVRKFEDGTMIIYSTQIWTSSSNTDPTTDTFPEPFIDTPCVSLTFRSTTTSENKIRILDVTPTNFTWGYRSTTGYTNGASASMLAVGRWK